jgi:hypothetical protein
VNILAIAAAFKTDRAINIFGRRQKKDKDRVSDYVDAPVLKTHPTILRRELVKMTDDNTSFVINPLKLLIVGFEI